MGLSDKTKNKAEEMKERARRPRARPIRPRETAWRAVGNLSRLPG